MNDEPQIENIFSMESQSNSETELGMYWSTQIDKFNSNRNFTEFQ